MPDTITSESNTSTGSVDLASPVALGTWTDPVMPAPLEQHTLAEVRVAEGILPPTSEADWSLPAGPRIHVDHAGATPRVLLHNGETDTVLPALWLRARSPDPSQRDVITGQRLMNPHLLPDDLSLLDARIDARGLQLAFSDGFSGHFDPAELIAGAVLDEGCPAPLPWQADLAPQPWYGWGDLSDDGVLHRALRDYIERGFLLLHGTPTQADSILTIARRFGFVRETNFGSFFEVYSRPDSTDLAYRPVALGPHTDNPYRNPVPGIQLLHCLQNETSGGLSTLVDSLAVAQQLQQEDPEGFALLASVPVRYEYRDADTWLVAVQPMIELTGKGAMMGVFYSPRLDDIPLMSDADTRAYHRARKRFGTLLSDPRFELRFRLEPGQLMMFDNNRVLHGRTSFDPSEGHRQLQGCYIDRDSPRSLYRVLSRRLGAAVA
ncbi:TauD/TfdA family dioxygenase [Comamonadaceae bacterium G21597-S1]|nr:TauD/TfdA family dioxygenase [Comamonadaceae bacterium G21597-S1]